MMATWGPKHVVVNSIPPCYLIKYLVVFMTVDHTYFYIVSNSTFCPHGVFTRFLRYEYSINLLVSVSEMQCILSRRNKILKRYSCDVRFERNINHSVVDHKSNDWNNTKLQNSRTCLLSGVSCRIASSVCCCWPLCLRSQYGVTAA
jgi:hypothetical protein